MSKAQIILASVFTIIISVLVSCFIYTEEIKKIILNKYYLIIAFLILFIICNTYSTEVRDKEKQERNGLKYLENFSISFFSIGGIVFVMLILLFVIEWIKSLFN